MRYRMGSTRPTRSSRTARFELAPLHDRVELRARTFGLRHLPDLSHDLVVRDPALRHDGHRLAFLVGDRLVVDRRSQNGLPYRIVFGNGGSSDGGGAGVSRGAHALTSTHSFLYRNRTALADARRDDSGAARFPTSAFPLRAASAPPPRASRPAPAPSAPRAARRRSRPRRAPRRRRARSPFSRRPRRAAGRPRAPGAVASAAPVARSPSPAASGACAHIST
jgi:hypothetical protein